MEIQSFGLGVGVACLAAGVVGRPFARRRGISAEDWWWLVTGLMVSGVIGGRLLHILPDAGYYFQYPYEIIRPPIEGLSYYGAVLFGALYVGFFARRVRMSFWQAADLIALPWLVALLLVSLFWGAPVAKASAPWGVRVSLDLLYLTGIYLLLAWTRRELRRPANYGRLAMAVLAGDGLLRLVTGWWFARYLPPAMAVPLADHLARGAAFVVGGTFFLAARGAAASRLPVDFGRRSFSRWAGWVLTYVALVLIRVAATG